ncbi:MAG TPA: PAS domain-containing sensor histidine kinase [Gemmatimonadaceae bacterium]|nr:PAS domain-containing sensor histidine kinase [Gemmatimonadaceae bacterium]
MTQLSIPTTELYRLLVESVKDYAIFALDPNGYVVSWNPGAQRFKGYTAPEIIGKHFSVFYPPEDLAVNKPQIELEIAAEVGRLEDEGWRVRKDGTQFWANVVITALRGADGELVGFAKVTRDLTQRRAAELQAVEDARRIAAEEALRRAAEMRSTELADLLDRTRRQAEEIERRRNEADVANRTKTEFLAAMSHELRTPLNAIAGYVQLLLLGVRGPLSSEQSGDLTRIQRSQQHLLSLINDILNFSRLEAGAVTYEIGPVPLSTVLDAAAAMIGPQAAAKRITFALEPCPPTVRALADASKLEQILLNLVSNAVKFTQTGGHVSIRCVVADDHVLTCVQDNGPGIPADRLADIFEPFVQLDRTLGNPREGVGLGLAISRDLARGMQGDLTVESALGKGSTFTVSLKRATAATDAEPRVASDSR